ncbi:APC family permease [Vagococcus zengguangii]|uniref:Amino acid permease n=1 Tax=Vagococcus zengguangii TaxID=2571750 RepID=A0A4D7CTS4_9ENTE|nr:amino acid permease [Vagococcus zengguangii]QCI85781.1 amino acid permease [Vagococcus zengguangii]TLG81722.1 amino acid permease [Vagococcus zengguangii]
MSENSHQLKRTLGFTVALTTIIGIVIGSGIFFKPYAIFRATGGEPGLGILAWILAGLLSLAGALTASEIAAMIPKTGGMVTYLHDIFGPKIGFLSGWVDSSLYQTGSIAAVAVVFGVQASSLLGLDPNAYWPKVVISIVTIVFLGYLCNLGAEASGRLQMVLTLCKMIPITLIVVVSFVKGTGHDVLTPLVGPEIDPGKAFSLALLAALFAFDGWISVGMLAGEMKNPSKDLPRALILGLTIVSLIYVVINIAYLWVMPANQLMLTETPAADVSRVLFGRSGGQLVSIGILISVFGSLNGFIMTAARSTYTFAETRKIPFSEALMKVNDNGSPVNATWFVVIVSSIYCLTGKFDLLTDLSTFMVWIFYCLTFYGVIKWRRERPDAIRPYKVPLYPVIPIIAIMGGGYVVISTLITQFTYAISGIIIMLAGLPIYYYYTMKETKASGYPVKSED